MFTISPRANLPTGTTLCNTASVIFDLNAPILTPRWCNTFDDVAPKSGVKALSVTTAALTFAVQWAGTDQGSAIRDYSVYVSDNGGAYTNWIADTSATRANFTGVNGHTYRFYSVARDLAGNTEAAKTAAEATTKVFLSAPCANNGTPQFQVARGGYRYSAMTRRIQAVCDDHPDSREFALRSLRAGRIRSQREHDRVSAGGDDGLHLAGSFLHRGESGRAMEFRPECDCNAAVQQPDQRRDTLDPRAAGRIKVLRRSMTSNLFAAAVAVSLAGAALAHGATFQISLDTSTLPGHPAGPFSLAFQLTDGKRNQRRQHDRRA